MNLNISRDEASCLKGYAILCIVLHNLLHLVAPLVKENEFYYNYNYRSYWMWNHMKEIHPNLLADILSFFGWYGVPIFIFLSGYGITRKYENSKRTLQETSWPHFFCYNFKKLWGLMAPAFVIYLLLGVIFWDKEFSIFPIICQLTMTINFLCPPKYIDPGVYWYFGLTLQLYCVYRLFFFKKTVRSFWFWLTVLAIGSVLFCWMLLPNEREKVQPVYEYFSHNCFRWLLPFLLGVSLGRYGRERKDNWLLIFLVSFVSLGLLILFSFNQILWIFTPILAIGFFMGIVKIFMKVQPLRTFGIWLGGLSAYLFAVHPLVRPFFSNLIVSPKQLYLDGESWLWTAVYLFVAIVVAWGYRWISHRYLVSLCERIINRCVKSVSFKKK